MYQDIIIIGVGSLGGYLAQNISRMNGINTLTLIDNDFIESKNIGKSIYKRKDIGKLKVEVLKEYLDDTGNLQIIGISSIYKEGVSWLSKNDLVIDCRDVTCRRDGEIDIRVYISFGSLIIDCKRIKKVVKDKQGRYIGQPSSNELLHAALILSTYISTGELKEMIDRQMIYTHQLNQIQTIATKSIQKFNKLPDMVLDDHKGFDKIRNMFEMLPDIVELSKTKELTVFVGSHINNYAIGHYKKSQLTVANNASKELSNLVQTLVYDYPSYTIAVGERAVGKAYIELLPETGGA